MNDLTLRIIAFKTRIMKKVNLLCLIICISILHCACGQKNDNSKGAFYTGKYRNLFLENGHSPEEISAKIEGAFRQLFHGDSATQAIYFKAGSNENGPMAYVCDVLHNDVRSEGISYGMMIAVQMDKKAEFDA